ncbi:hypothetical protein TWF106_008501 [Orbilia oligospora]|uniref:Peptidase A1 domain-containing protein n=1 Tax=Orbilia oligospora TaxID=2813651 RepID=A0A6G1MIM7_ORBOL|nr:hypothetical protein TWF106_008501 [Orbilia oligospora]KAF3221012.1 hypothetical protein TWF191_007221 [Orbilia oligospora]KAF3259000.1 hypothetical protein TWF192_011133 [Orbilia oligospora]
MGTFNSRVLATILSFLAFINFATSVRQGNTEYKKNIFPRRSALATGSQLVKRNTGNYVLLQTEYSLIQGGETVTAIFTNVTFGNDNRLKLHVWISNFTWVPERPKSISDFCNEEPNKRGCVFAETSGYYNPPANQPFLGNFSFWNGDLGLIGSSDGYYAEETLKVGDTTVNLELGISTFWNGRPILGLGFGGSWFPGRYNRLPAASGNDDSPPPINPTRTFLNNLRTQGKIASNTCSFYNVQDAGAKGQIILGALDRSKFYGGFDVYSWEPATDDSSGGEYGGKILFHPTVRLGNINDPANFTLTGYPSLHAPSNSSIQINPFYHYLSLPDSIYDPLINALYPFGLLSIDVQDPYNSGSSGSTYPTQNLPCDINIPPHHVLEFTFDKVTIRIPFNDLILRIPRPENPSFCGLAFWLLDAERDGYTPLILGGPFVKNAYVVLDPETRKSAIAGLSRNDTATDIVEIGGRYAATLMNVRGAAIDPSPNNGSSNKLPLGAAIGIGVGVGLVVIAAIVLGYFLYRRKKANAQKTSSIPSEESSAAEADSKALAPSELGATNKQAELPQNPSNQTNWQSDHIGSNRHELDASAGLLQELP